jgi:tRNA(fMet)-specific endonuclease VapC
MGYLLDTNIVSDLVRHPRVSRVRERIARAGEETVCTSISVAAELRYSAAKSGALRLAAQLQTVLGRLAVLPFEEPADRVYAELRARLERDGLPLAANDLLIAAQALAGSHTLVTADEAFARIPELHCENWLA